MTTKTAEQIAKECAEKIEADHQFGRMEPQRIIDRAAIDAARNAQPAANTV